MALASGAPRIGSRQAWATLAIGGLAGLAWLALWTWDASEYRRYLHHDGLAGSGLGDVALAGVFVGGWLLMLLAVMLPTAYPLITLFATVVRTRPHPRVLVACVAAGYVAVWTVAGLLAFQGDAVVHLLAERIAWIEQHRWAISAGAIALAGGYQFSALKDRCLAQCRSPRMFIFSHWRGRTPMAEAFMLGANHGRFCIGCCWALMALMFAVGLGSLAWMALLGAAMGLEKNAPWGARVTAPLGAALLVVAAGVVLVNL